MRTEALFVRSHMEKTRNNGYKLHQERFPLDTQNIFFLQNNFFYKNIFFWIVKSSDFTITGTSPGTWWNPRHWTFSRCSWTGCSIISSRLPFTMKGWIWRSFEVPSNLGCSVILWKCEIYTMIILGSQKLYCGYWIPLKTHKLEPWMSSQDGFMMEMDTCWYNRSVTSWSWSC